MPEKKVGFPAGFVTRWLGATGGGYFQTGLFRRGGRLDGLGDGEWADAEKEAIQFLSAVRQLLLVARGRERLSHKSSSSSALLCTR
jgi:hypothetical protein